ncbi:hypothetical protein EJB05_11810, partial [Eragrostis curvula]
MPLLHLTLPLPPYCLHVGVRRLLPAPAPRHGRLSVVMRATAVEVSAATEVNTLPFPPDQAVHHRELAAAADVVERACRLCVDVKKSLFSDRRNILEKNDETPVTIADFGVQALISLVLSNVVFYYVVIGREELQRLFPSIPLVAEEDSASLRRSEADDDCNYALVESIFSAVEHKVSKGDSPLTHDDVLRAIDRGGKNSVSFDSNHATYWVLDPIDGTKGFLKGDDALYVVGLALVVDEQLAVGVMGCPNWTEDPTDNENDVNATAFSGRGVLVVSHVGCGTWSRRLSAEIDQFTRAHDIWTRCYVDTCSEVHMARYCLSDGQTWDMIPLSLLFSTTTDEHDPRDDNKVLILPVFWGSLSKYLAVAAGRASVFVMRTKATVIRKSWDHAVGVICVQEAGGQTSDWSGKPLDFAADETSRRNIYPSGGFLASNGILHDKLIEMISANSK